VGVSELSSREAVAWRNDHAKKSLRLVYDLLAKRVDDLLYDTSMKVKVLQDLRDLRSTTEEVIDQYGVRQ